MPIQKKESTSSIIEHIGRDCNIILLNVTYFIALEQRSQLSKLEKDVTDEQRRDVVREK